MDVFKITPKNDGQVFIIRPLLNIKNLNKPFLSFKSYFNSNLYQWEYNRLCYALVNDELKIFKFKNSILKHLSYEMFLMNSDKALKITVKIKNGYLNNDYEIIQDNEYNFNITAEKRIYIENLLTTTNLDLYEALKEEKNKISNLEVTFISTINGSKIVKTLKEIYENE